MPSIQWFDDDPVTPSGYPLRSKSSAHEDRGAGVHIWESAPIGRDGRRPLTAADTADHTDRVLARRVLVALLSLPLLLGALVPVVPAAGASGDWPQFQSGPSHLGYNAQESILSPASLYRLQNAWTGTTDRGASSPVVADGVVYVGSRDGKLYAFPVECNSGGASCTPLWTGATGSGIEGSPAVADGVVYVGSTDGMLYAFAVGCRSDGGSCTPLWTGATGLWISSSPTVADGVVYVGAGTPASDVGTLFAFAVGCSSGGGSCTPLWSGLAGKLIYSSPAVADGVVYIGSNDHKLYAFAVGCSSGGGSCTPLWTGATGSLIYSSPAVADGVVYVGSLDHKLYAFAAGCSSDGGSCTPLWTGLTGDEIDNAPAVADGVVYVGSGDHKLYAFAVGCRSDGGSCTPLWTGLTGDAISSSPAVADGVVYVDSSDVSTLYAFAVGCNSGGGSCAPIWTGGPGDDFGFSSPAVANGVIYVGSNKLYAFAPTAPVDTTPPDATLSLNGGALSSTSLTTSATIGGTDAGSGDAGYRLSNDGMTWSSWSDWPVGQPNVTATWDVASGDGTKTAYAEVKDAAGNVSLPASAAIDLDTTVGSDDYGVSIDAGSDFTNSRDVLLDLPALPGTVAMKVSNDGGFSGAVWQPYAAHLAWTLGDPHGVIVTKNVYVKFKDANGILSNRSDDIVIDPTAPAAGSGPASVGVPGAPSAVVSPASAKTAHLNTTAHDQSGGSGVTDMELSASKTFAGAVWQPYAPSATWSYDTRAATTVYERFRDGAGNVSKTYKKVLASPATPTIPTQVAPLNGLTTTSRHPAFSWLALTGAKKYQLEVSTGGTFATTLLNTTTTKLSVIPSSSLPTGTLYWRVRKSGGSWSPVWSFTVPISDPPTLSSPAAGATLGTLSPDLTWGAIAGASSYQVELGPDASFLSGVQTFSASGTHQQLAPLARQAAYWWRVRAKLGSTYGPWSTGRSFITPAIDTVSLLTPAGGATLSSLPALLDWADVTGATSYHLQVCSNSSCTTTVRDTSVTNSLYQLTTPLTNGTYWWRVEAVSASATGAWSSVRSFVK